MKKAERLIRSKARPLTKASGSNEILLDHYESETIRSTYSADIAIIEIAWNEYEYAIIEQEV